MSTLIRWNPVREMAAMQSAMDRLFEDAWRGLSDDSRANAGHPLALDIHEDDQSYIVTTELPGVKSENIQVKLDGEYLVIEAEIPEQVIERENARQLVKERRYGHTSRRLRLPQNVDFNHTEATYENGVLTLNLPKSQETQPRVIPVRTGNTITSGSPSQN